jgi:hypothetical protein
MLLEPTDVITYRDDVIGRTTTLRVVAADEQNMDGSITFTCEEWSSAGIHVAAQVTPQGQASNAYKPAQGTDVGTYVVQPQAVPPQVVTARALTTSDFANLWPNATGQTAPPPGAQVANDGTNPEFDYLYNAGIGSAYAGAWVRRFALTTPGSVSLKLRIPAIGRSTFSPTFSARYQYKFISTGGTPSLTVTWRSLDATLTAVGSTLTDSGLGTPAGWSTRPPLAMSVDAAAVWKELEFKLTTSTAGTAEAWLDAIEVYRMIQATDVSSLPATGWTGVAASLLFQNGWTDVGGGIMLAAYMKDPFGMAHLRGEVRNTNPPGAPVPTTIFQLPVGNRPTATVYYAVEANNAYGRVKVDSTGNVVLDFGSNTGGVSLDGINFDTQ